MERVKLLTATLNSDLVEFNKKESVDAKRMSLSHCNFRNSQFRPSRTQNSSHCD